MSLACWWVCTQVVHNLHIPAVSLMDDLDSQTVDFSNFKTALIDELRIMVASSASEAFVELVGPSIAIAVWNRLPCHFAQKQSNSLDEQLQSPRV